MAIEILGDLDEYFQKETLCDLDVGMCFYKGDIYQVWEVSNSLFNKLSQYSEEKWLEKFPNSWWRYAEGSNLGVPDCNITINGCKLMGWLNIFKNNNKRRTWPDLQTYLEYALGATQPKNVCAITTDLAAYNDIKLSKLFTLCQPVKVEVE